MVDLVDISNHEAVAEEQYEQLLVDQGLESATRRLLWLFEDVDRQFSLLYRLRFLKEIEQKWVEGEYPVSEVYERLCLTIVQLTRRTKRPESETASFSEKLIRCLPVGADKPQWKPVPVNIYHHGSYSQPPEVTSGVMIRAGRRLDSYDMSSKFSFLNENVRALAEHILNSLRQQMSQNMVRNPYTVDSCAVNTGMVRSNGSNSVPCYIVASGTSVAVLLGTNLWDWKNAPQTGLESSCEVRLIEAYGK